MKMTTLQPSGKRSALTNSAKVDGPSLTSSRKVIYTLWRNPTLHRWLLPLAAILTLTGYFGPWVSHRVAGLVVTGLDLGEYVKFLPTVRGGQVMLWREGFYLPLVAVSLALSLAAFRPQWRYGWPMRSLLLIIAGIAALNLLPPAWGPATFTNPEFRQQILALALCLGAAAISPFLALLSRWVGSSVVLLLSLAALWFPLRDFLRVLPTIRELYNEPLSPGWGVYVMVIGLLLMMAAQMCDLLYRQPTKSTVETLG